MQDERYIRRQDPTSHHPMSTLQTARLLVIADIKLDQETRRTNLNLRRILGHLHVLESLQPAHLASMSSRSNETMRFPSRIVTPSTSCPTTTTVETEYIPDLETDHETDDANSEEWSSDEEPEYDDDFDAHHALVRVPSHPPRLARESRIEVCDAAYCARLLEEKTAQKRESQARVVASVVEVVEWDD